MGPEAGNVFYRRGRFPTLIADCWGRVSRGRYWVICEAGDGHTVEEQDGRWVEIPPQGADPPKRGKDRSAPSRSVLG